MCRVLDGISFVGCTECSRFDNLQCGQRWRFNRVTCLNQNIISCMFISPSILLISQLLYFIRALVSLLDYAVYWSSLCPQMPKRPQGICRHNDDSNVPGNSYFLFNHSVTSGDLVATGDGSTADTAVIVPSIPRGPIFTLCQSILVVCFVTWFVDPTGMSVASLHY